MIKFAFGLATVLAITVSGDGHAYVNPPTLTPQNPAANESIQMQVESGHAHYIGEYPADPAMFPIVTRNGQTIRVEVFGIDYTNTSPFVPIPPNVRTIALGGLPAGNYTVELVLAEPWPVGFGYTTAHTVPLVVGGGGAPVTLPAGDWRSALLLSMGLAIFGTAAVRRRNRQR